jgi:membrane protein required for colicin V production
MHTLDILFVIIALVFVIIGMRRGLVSELFRLIALVTGFLAAFLYYPKATALLTFVPPSLSFTLAFIILFIVTALIVLAIGWMIRKMIHLTPLGWIDHLLGGAIGLLKTVFLFWILCFAFAMFPLSMDKIILHRSTVFHIYKKLPEFLKPAGLARLRKTLKIDPFPTMHPHMLNKGHSGERPWGPQERNADSPANVI